MRICWVSIIGRPNVGKSTLINHIIKYDLSIISPVAQTTRDQIMGVYTDNEYQIIFTDTPGIHKPLSEFGQTLNNKALETIKENDVILFLSPIDQEISKGDELILDQIKNVKNKIAVITKMDLINNPEDLKIKEKMLNSYEFTSIIHTSDKKEKSFDFLLNEIKKFACEDNKYFDEDFITDRTETFLTKEIIRSSAIKYLTDELPHSIVVEISDYIIDDKLNKRNIDATIYCKKESQKGIIIGKNGSMIKKIGINARKQIMNKFSSNVHLNLNIKVDKNWVDNKKSIKKFGY